MKFLKALSFILTLQVAVSSFSAEYTIRWKINHTPEKYFISAVETFKKNVEKETNGRVTAVAIMNSKESANSDQLLKSVKSGDVEMAQVYTTVLADKVNPMFNVFDLPFLFQGYDHADRVFEGAVGGELLAVLDGSGVKGLGFTYSGGLVVFAAKNKIVRQYEDMSNASVKTLGGYLPALSLTQLGAREGTAKADLYSSTYAHLKSYFEDKRDGFKAVNETNHRLLVTTLLINEKFFSALPEDLQKAVKRSARLTATEERENIIREGESVKRQLVQDKIQIQTLSQKERTRWASHLVPVYTKFYENTPAGSVFVQKIQNEGNARRKQLSAL